MESRRNALEVSTHAVARLALRREFRVLRTSQSSRAAEVCVIARENPCLDKDCSTPSRLRHSQKKRPRVILLSVFSSHVDDLSIKELSQDFLYRQITPFALVLQPLTAQKRVICRICDEGTEVNKNFEPEPVSRACNRDAAVRTWAAGISLRARNYDKIFRHLSGRVAQRERRSLTRTRSQVQILPRPPL